MMYRIAHIHDCGSLLQLHLEDENRETVIVAADARPTAEALVDAFGSFEAAIEEIIDAEFTDFGTLASFSRV